MIKWILNKIVGSKNQREVRKLKPVVRRILANSTSQSRKIINTLLKYPKDSAGSIMTTEYICLKAGWTVDQAFDLIR